MGNHLRDFTRSYQGSSSDRDAFARSAFNRYYYASFLCALGLLRSIQGDTVHVSHKDAPEYLQGSFKKFFLSSLTTSWNDELITGHEYKYLRSQVLHYTSEIADVLKKSYSVRSIADYKPEIAVDLAAGTFSLSGCHIGTAQGWHDSIFKARRALENVWVQLAR